MKADGHDVRDSLVRDAVKGVADAGRVPDVRGTTDYIVDVLEGMDRKAALAEKNPAPAKQVTKPKRSKVDAVSKEFKRRTGRDLEGGWTIDKAKKRRMVKVSELERVGRLRLAQRLAWMRSQPALRKELQEVAAFLYSENKDIREKAAEKVRQLIAKSNRLAGHDWRKPKPEKLVFSG